MLKKITGFAKKYDMGLLMFVIFTFMLLLNTLTPYVADDFVYRLGFHDKTRLQTLGDVVKSMYVHCFRMNGRLISHGLEQIYMLMPKMVFNICNAAVFTASIYVIYRISNFGKHKNPLLVGLVFAAVWYFTPVFGQVMLWQVGSLNYLWGVFLCLLFLCPYMMHYVSAGAVFTRKWMKVLFCVGSLITGMYIETSSFIAILLGAALWIISWLERKKPEKWMLLPLVICAVGYIVMMTMPAEVNAKHGDVTLEILLKNIDTATEMLGTRLLPLVIAWCCLICLAITQKVSRERTVLSCVCAFGAVAAHYMPIVAAYYPERCMITTTVLLIMACGLIITDLKTEAAVVLRSCVCGVLAAVFLVSVVDGSYDIWKCHTSFTAREIVIEAEKEAGNTDLVLGCVHPETEYSAFWGVLDLNTETADTWPNSSMAVCYGVDSILGY